MAADDFGDKRSNAISSNSSDIFFWYQNYWAISVLKAMLIKKMFPHMGPGLLLRSDDIASRLTNGSAAFIWKLHCQWLKGLR